MPVDCANFPLLQYQFTDWFTKQTASLQTYTLKNSILCINMCFSTHFQTNVSIKSHKVKHRKVKYLIKIGQAAVKNIARSPSSSLHCTRKSKLHDTVWFRRTSKILETKVARFPVLRCMLWWTTHTHLDLISTVCLLHTHIYMCKYGAFLHNTDVLHISSTIQDPSTFAEQKITYSKTLLL